MANGKKGKLLGFFHFPFAICHSGCVFQHPAKGASLPPKGGSHKMIFSHPNDGSRHDSISQ
jgi:hypothetical protein